MRTTQVLEMIRGSKTGYVRRGRYITPERVPYKEILPIKLKNSVSGKSDRSSGPVCIQEMSILFSCLKKNDFSDQSCSKELDSFNKCYTQQVSSKERQKTKDLVGELSPGEKQLSHRQVNRFLKMFPH